jgi:hypothetical protein
MTPYAAEIRTIIAEAVRSIADVSTGDHKTHSVATVILKRTGKVITHEFVHGIGYSVTARDWAKSALMEYGPSNLA